MRSSYGKGQKHSRGAISGRSHYRLAEHDMTITVRNSGGRAHDEVRIFEMDQTSTAVRFHVSQHRTMLPRLPILSGARFRANSNCGFTHATSQL